MAYNKEVTVYDTIRRQDVEKGVLIIPTGVTKIDVNVAQWQSLNGETIYEVKIPETVTEIGNNVFEKCFHLREVHLHDNITCIGTRCFAGCTNLQRINWPKNTRVIATGTFAGAEIDNLYLPKELQHIRDKAFKQACVYNLNIENIIAYAHIFFASKTASPFCEFTKLYIAGMAIGDSLTIKLSPSVNTSIANFAFYNMQKIKTLILVNVEIIGKSSFENTSIETVTFEYGLNQIFNDSFAGCNKLKEIHFGCPTLIFSETSFPDIPNPVTVKVSTAMGLNEYCFPELNNQLLDSVLELPEDYLPF